MKKKKRIQLQIDFSLPYLLTPTLEELKYELKLTDKLNCPHTIMKK